MAVEIAQIIKNAEEHNETECLQKAEEQYRQVLQSQPDNAHTLHILGIIAHRKENNQSAVELISEAITINSQVPQFYNNLGVALKSLGKFEEALQAYKKALQLKPDYADAHYNMGNALTSLQQYDTAVEHYNQALLIKPDDAYTYYNTAVAMQELGHHSEAIENFERAIQLNHNSTEVYRAMAASQKALGQYDDATNTLRNTLSLYPNCAQTHTDLGMMLLLTGNFSEGWKEYHWRLENCEWTKRFPHRLRWDGSNFAGKKLLVRCEQGMGDNIHFVRYLPMVKPLGGTVIFAIYEELYNLLKDYPGVDETINLSNKNQSAAFDLYAPILDLPGIFGTTLDTIPAQVPYIYAEPHKVGYWSERVCGPGLKVGIVWSGSHGRGGKHLRNCNLKDFAVLLDIKGVKLYSLQKGESAKQLEQSKEKIPAVNLGEQFKDFSDTAAAIENLDLIISVDTSVLHLAGAMGKLSWGLTPCAPDWRWMLHRIDCPWYPTMRLFRQTKLGQWDDVFLQIATQLHKLTALTTSHS